jgi:hypothetical protein
MPESVTVRAVPAPETDTVPLAVPVAFRFLEKVGVWC